jgi:hypothetical protein
VTNISEIIADLAARRSCLDEAIRQLQALDSEKKPSAAAKVSTAKPLAAQKHKPSKALRKSCIELASTSDKPMSITDAIRQAVREGDRTIAEIADRVEELIPGVRRASISEIAMQRVKAGEFYKDSNLKVRFVKGAN